MIPLWIVLAVIVLLFIIDVKLLIIKALFKTKALQWAKHRKDYVSPEALWVWRLMFALTLIVGVGEFVKAGNPIMTSTYNSLNYVGLLLLVLGLWALAAAMNSRKQYLWFWQVLGPKETIPPFTKTGIYASVRNPRELALILLLGGLAATFSLKFMLVFSVILLFATMFKASSRDRILMEKHGKQYIDYTRTSKKLIPYIY